MSVPAPLVGHVHTISVVSRSGRASAEVMRIEIDEDGRTLDQVATAAAERVYRSTDDQDRHAELADAILRALETCEAIPGDDVVGEGVLPDGRRARARRELAYA